MTHSSRFVSSLTAGAALLLCGGVLLAVQRTPGQAPAKAAAPSKAAPAKAAPTKAGAPRPYTTWNDHGGRPESMQYSALSQINKSNVDQLEMAGTVRGQDVSREFPRPSMQDRGASRGGGRGHRVASRLSPAGDPTLLC